jgi:type IV secretory pathway VirB2 component (pilin)
MNKYIKFVAAAIIIALGVYLMFNRNIGWGIVLVVLSAIPIALFFKNENILLAFGN